MKEKILLVLLVLVLCLSTCQTEYYPAAGYSSMYGGDALYGGCLFLCGDFAVVGGI
jgi:F0F1-type ATP synthase assembly protein I